MEQYKMNVQTSVVFLYNNNKLSEKEIRKTFPIIVAPKRVECLGINLSKEVKNMCKTCKN